MQSTYFPVTLEQLGATIRYRELVEGRLRIGDIEVTCRYLNHPALTLGYRLEADGAAPLSMRAITNLIHMRLLAASAIS